MTSTSTTATPSNDVPDVVRRDHPRGHDTDRDLRDDPERGRQIGRVVGDTERAREPERHEQRRTRARNGNDERDEHREPAEVRHGLGVDLQRPGMIDEPDSCREARRERGRDHRDEERGDQGHTSSCCATPRCTSSRPSARNPPRSYARTAAWLPTAVTTRADATPRRLQLLHCGPDEPGTDPLSTGVGGDRGGEHLRARSRAHRPAARTATSPRPIEARARSRAWPTPRPPRRRAAGTRGRAPRCSPRPR